MMVLPRLSVVIVNHHRPDLLADALRALYASERRPDEIVVVETDATDAPSLPADDRAPTVPVRLLLLPDNPGYAAACNRGAAQASGDWVLFMNADVNVSPDCLGAVLAEATADPRIGIATCRLVRPDGSLDHACHRGIPSVVDSLVYKARLDRVAPRSKRLGHYRLSWLDPATVHDVEACSGAFLLIRREALDVVGGWDERYWFYAEDLDLCLRVTQAGWRVRYVGTASGRPRQGQLQQPAPLTGRPHGRAACHATTGPGGHHRLTRALLPRAPRGRDGATPAPPGRPHVPTGPGPHRPTRVGRMAPRPDAVDPSRPTGRAGPGSSSTRRWCGTCSGRSRRRA